MTVVIVGKPVINVKKTYSNLWRHYVQELKDVLGMVADVLKSFAEGMRTVAGKVDALAQAQGGTEMKPDEPKPKTIRLNKAERVKKLATQTTVKKPVKKAALKAAHENKPVTQPAVKNPVKKKTVLKPAPENKEAGTASDTVFQLISDATNGIETGAIMEKSGFDQKKVSNIIHRLKQQGKIESPKRGMYSKKG